MLNFQYYISHKNKKVLKDSDLWNDFIPDDRKKRKQSNESITYGSFFVAAHRFLENNIEKIPVLKDRDVKNISIFLDKHGKFYHPARIEVEQDNEDLCFVLNTAVTETGKMCMNFEIDSLTKLNKAGLKFIPEIYFSGDIQIEETELSMFCGNWFENYCEFHISPYEESQKIIVWDPSGNYYLTHDEEIEVYRQCSKIMTLYYDENSFSQISPWHHAAGDFILKKYKESIDVKLITVRQFAPFAETEEPDSDMKLYGLLYFFIGLSIRMRLDRFNGVDETVWAKDHAIEGFINGFFEAISQKEPVVAGNSSLKKCFCNYISSLDFNEFFDMCEDLINSYNENSPDIPLIRNNIESHAKKIFDLF
ncbi:MAG: hypothetical protein GY793_11800 [Proteobacteria bacterium]|nr:hypothetical protein [Pseudomonadota bacterium]